MNLTTATEPVKENETRTVRTVIKPARYKPSKTGEKILLPPEIEEREIEVEVWAIYTTYDGETERHSFSTKESADNYYAGF